MTLRHDEYGHSGGMHRAVLSMRPDGSDGLQAWIDVTADNVPLRMLLDTGSAGTDVPHVEPFASRVTAASSTGKSAFGAVSSTPVAHLHPLHVGDLIVGDLLVGVQPADWPHPPCWGRTCCPVTCATSSSAWSGWR